jgi:YVTN family beta-propeller protein
VSHQTGTMTVISGTNNQVAATVPAVGTLPVAVAVNSTTNMVYVLGQGTPQNLNVYSGATNALVGGVAVSGTTYALAVDSTTNTIFASSLGTVTTVPATQTTPATVLSGPWLTVIDGVTNAITATVLQQNTLTTLAVNEMTNTVYGSNTAENLLAVITPQGTLWVTEANIMVGGSPGPIAVNPTTNTVYVGNTATASVSVVNGATDAVTTTVPLTAAPTGLAANSGANLLYVAEAANVAVINGATNAVSGTVAAVQTASSQK